MKKLRFIDSRYKVLPCEELKIGWELVKEDYKEKGKEIPVAPARHKFSSSL